MLDSGASISYFGNSLAADVISDKTSKLSKFYGNVRTADGQKQRVAGTMDIGITFGTQTKTIKVLVIPELKQDMICA